MTAPVAAAEAAEATLKIGTFGRNNHDIYDYFTATKNQKCNLRNKYKAKWDVKLAHKTKTKAMEETATERERVRVAKYLTLLKGWTVQIIP